MLAACSGPKVRRTNGSRQEDLVQAVRIGETVRLKHLVLVLRELSSGQHGQFHSKDSARETTKTSRTHAA